MDYFIAHKNNLFVMDKISLVIRYNDFHVCGTGDYLAYLYLNKVRGTNLTPLKKIREAFKIVQTYNRRICFPVIVRSTKNNESIIIYE